MRRPGVMLLQQGDGAVGPASKECRKCGVTKDASAFQMDRHNVDGLQSYCRRWHTSLDFCTLPLPRRMQTLPSERACKPPVLPVCWSLDISLSVSK